MLGHEVGVLPEAIARTLDLDDDGVVKKPVQKGRCDHGVTKNLAPFCKTAVRGEDHGTLLVTGVDELEEQVAAAGNDRQVADLIDDEQREAAEEADFLAQSTLALGLGEGADQVGERGEVDAAPGFDRLDTERQAEVALTGAGRADESARPRRDR